jgi:pyruvate dehydrogenase E2 component (dihydrolipoamide acetyltransferase)
VRRTEKKKKKKKKKKKSSFRLNFVFCCAMLRLIIRGHASNAVAVSSKPLSPAVARLIREHPTTPLASIRGTGPKGHILKADLLAFLANPTTKIEKTNIIEHSQPTAPAAVGTRRRRAPGSPASFDAIPTSQVRRVIATRLHASKFALPHAYVSRQVTVDRVLALRQKLKADKAPLVPSVSDFIIRAAALALRRVPAVNVVRDAKTGALLHSPTVDVGFAVSVDGAPDKPFSGSLLTPIVARADRLSVGAIADQTKQLIAKARANKLKPNEFQGGSFCISNLGMFEITEFTAIINAPQSAILAVGAPIERVAADRSVATTVTVTLSIDNSAIEHDEAARWLDEFALHIEEPALL